ncbi:hypothetical protein [Enterovibrio calviensis]|uniref:hypothetical protein n=1 Tax=Enterovibrio calviensis TaxID=91359 RepID=UPI000480D8B6|nr:hypothetical protein [Enterovibrio calviensis]
MVKSILTKVTLAIGGCLLALSSSFSHAGTHGIAWSDLGDPFWHFNLPLHGVGTLSPREHLWAATDISSRWDKSAKLSQRVAAHTGTWMNGRRYRAFDIYVENAVTPTESEANGDLIQALLGNGSNGHNYCKWLDLPFGINGIWNGGWAGHTTGISLGLSEGPSTSISVNAGTECDPVHNGYGFNVSVGASLSNPFLDAINIAQFGLPLKITFNAGVGASVKASLGGGYTGYFGSVPHPIHAYGWLRLPEYAYSGISPSVNQNFGVNIAVGIGLTLNVGGSVNSLSVSNPFRLEGGLTRDNNPKNWKFYVRSNAKTNASSFGGGINAAVKLSAPPYTYTIWKGNLLSWAGFPLWSHTIFDRYKKGKIIINQYTGQTRLGSVRGWG